jgi:hypothetical protein
VRGLVQSFREAPERWLEWNDSLDNELERIQTALNQIAESLDPHRGLRQQ